MRFQAAAIAVAMVTGGAAPVRSAERLTDPQLKQLMQSVDQGFDAWKDDLERRNMDEAVIRSAAGTVDVRQFLKDLEKDIDLVKDRLDSSYAAGPEVTAVLRRASDVERRYATQGGPEAWKGFRDRLAALAAAYGVGFPLDATASAQRKSDGEVAADAKRLVDSADRLRSGALQAAADAKRPKAERDAAERGFRDLKEAAKQLESNLKSHRAVSSDATRVLDLSSKAVAFAKDVGPMKAEATTALAAVESASQAIGTAFGTGGP